MLVRCEVSIRYEGPVVDGLRTPVIMTSGPRVTQSESPMVYGPTDIIIDGERYDLLMASPDSTRALAVPASELVWLCYPEHETHRSRVLEGCRLVKLANGIWTDH